MSSLFLYDSYWNFKKRDKHEYKLIESKTGKKEERKEKAKNARKNCIIEDKGRRKKKIWKEVASAILHIIINTTMF